LKRLLSVAINILLLFFLIQFSAAETIDKIEPEWVLYQKGLGFYNDKNYGEAFKYLRKSTEIREFPEAEYWIGKVFENEGENTLALKQYERALEYSDKAETPDFWITVHSGIADIYEKQKKYNLYNSKMEELINNIKNDLKIQRDYENLLADRLIENGLDKLLFYFRHEGDSLVKPYGETGIYYFKHSRDRNAIKYLVSAVTVISSELAIMFKEYDPEYRYTDFRQLFIDSEKNDEKYEYMKAVDFYKYIFYLALTLDNIGQFGESRYIFSILSESRAANIYKDMAVRIKNSNYSSTYKDGIKKALLLPSEQ
jgi:tetratricopeptide (TPR) repeat protein